MADNKFQTMVDTPTMIDLDLDLGTMRVTNPDGSQDIVKVNIRKIRTHDLGTFMDVWDLPDGDLMDRF